MSFLDPQKEADLPRYREMKDAVAKAALECGRSPENILLLAVSKGCSLEEILAAYKDGCRDFGESRVQEALEKIENAPKDINWHLIGSLQTNKVKKAIGKFKLIHSVDSYELAEKISNASIKIPILLQVNTSGESTKHGLSPQENLEKFFRLPGVSVEGLMTMAPFVENEAVIRDCFVKLRNLRDQYGLKHLSMGMSHDWRIAIEEGATILRIGTNIFG